MAIQKTEALSLGKGSILDHSSSIVAFSSANSIGSWSAIPTYTENQTVEYNSAVWKCLLANTGSAPAIGSTYWEIIYKNVKDGDICFSFNGSSSGIQQRAGGVWQSYRQPGLTISLADGQASPEVAITYIGNTSYLSKLEYTIKRGSGEGRKRYGSMNIMNDGTSELAYDHEFFEIGDDVNVWVTPVISAGIVQLQYTSGFESNPIVMSYILKGWV